MTYAGRNWWTNLLLSATHGIDGRAALTVGQKHHRGARDGLQADGTAL